MTESDRLSTPVDNPLLGVGGDPLGQGAQSAGEGARKFSGFRSYLE